jgi:hypothetical protein
MTKTCFYCDALVSGAGKGDHFPVPDRHGGAETVPCCQSCHDMKDRFQISDWPVEWISKVIADFPALSRETRIFLAKAISLFSDARRHTDAA